MPRAFFGTFFRAERKYYPLRGGSPTTRAVVGASIPPDRGGFAPLGPKKGSPLAFWKPSGTKAGEKFMETAFPAITTK